jgi:hypothetical protein
MSLRVTMPTNFSPRTNGNRADSRKSHDLGRVKEGAAVPEGDRWSAHHGSDPLAQRRCGRAAVHSQTAANIAVCYDSEQLSASNHEQLVNPVTFWKVARVLDRVGRGGEESLKSSGRRLPSSVNYFCPSCA